MHLSRIVPLALTLSLLLPAGAFAVNNQYADGRAIDLNAIDPASPPCDDFCSIVLDTKGKSKSLSGEGDWAEPDDQWCANHAVGTNPGVVAKPPTGTKPTTPCNVPLLAGDGSCSDVNRRLQHCKLHGSQLETHCAAYVGIKESTKGEKIVLGLDTAAAATCGMACAGNFVPGGQVLIKACGVAGAAASAGEIIQVFKAKKDMQKYISGAGGGLGAGFSAAGLLGKGESEKTVYSITKDGIDQEVLKGADGKFTTPDGKAITDSVTEKKVSDKGKGNACKAAIVFAAMTGIRVYNMKSNSSSKKKSCQQVNELVSSALAPGFKPLAGTTGGTTGTSGSSSSGTTGNGTVTTQNSSGGGNPTRSGGGVPFGGGGGSYGQCLADPKCTNQALGGNDNKSAAKDAGLLKDSGLADLLAKQARDLPADELERELDRGKSADAVLGTMFGGSGSPVAALGDIAKAAGKDGGSATDVAAMTTPISGAATAGQQARAEETPFKLMDSGSGAPSETGFDQAKGLTPGPSCDAADIWHSNCQGDPTIFEIVSGKINQSQDKVDKLGWVLPMNRKIAGGK